MWEGSERVLADYAITCIEEWKKRGYKDTCLDKILKLKEMFPPESNKKPWWLGDEKFHLSHASNLLRKNPQYYSQFFGNIPNNLPYLWPTKG